MAAKFEISKDKSGKFRFHLKAANGEIIAASQGYETRASAEKGIESVKTSAPGAKVVDLTERGARAQLARIAVSDHHCGGGTALSIAPGRCGPKAAHLSAYQRCC